MPDTRLCATVTADTMADLRARRDAVRDADMVELRLDTVRDPDAAAALHGRRLPVIITCRPPREGGHFTGAEEERLRILADAQRLGAEYVDVEWSAPHAPLIAATAGRGVVLSSHDFDGVPSDLPARAAAMRATGAEVIKLAVTASRLRDTLVLRDVAGAGKGAAVVLAMGEPGWPTRILAARFGSAWTFAGSLDAIGQLTPTRMVTDFGFRRISPRTRLFGVVGQPIGHSLSPAMHNAAFAAAGVDAVYLPLAAADFDDFLHFADGMPIEGASVTAPFKIDACDRADACDDLTRRIGSANTLRREGARWIARNTDVDGFLAPLQDAIALEGRRVTVLGAGGAARAAIEALRTARACVSVCARRADRAEALARRTGAAVAAWPPAAGSWDVLVNATPAGTAPQVEASPLPGGPFDGHLVYDLVYNPADTRLLRDARAAGCRTLGGLDMLVAQAQAQFAWWTGAPAPAGVMRAAATAALGAPRGSHHT